jgi:hypothetical protein
MYETQARAQGTTWKTITLSLPSDTAMPVPAGQWQRQDGRILATYTPEELTLSVQLALEEKRHHLQTRLERELDVLAASTGCDNTQADQLLACWDALNAEYAATITALAPVIGAD